MIGKGVGKGSNQFTSVKQFMAVPFRPVSDVKAGVEDFFQLPFFFIKFDSKASLFYSLCGSRPGSAFF